MKGTHLRGALILFCTLVLFIGHTALFRATLPMDNSLTVVQSEELKYQVAA